MKHSLPLLPVIVFGLTAPAIAGGALVWETSRPFDSEIALDDLRGVTDADHRGDWEAVTPAQVEAGHAFAGNAVVACGDLTAVFERVTGNVIAFIQVGETWRERFRIAPEGDARAEGLVASRDPGTGAVTVTFDFADGRRLAFRFRDAMIEVAPTEDIRGVDIVAQFAYAIVPTFIGDDLVYDPRRAGGLEALQVPAENALLGLMKEPESILVACWPEGNQEVELHVAGAALDRIRLVPAGQRLCLGLLTCPGLWHAAAVDAESYEQDMPIEWRPPFPARWLTQFVYQPYAAGDWTNPPPLVQYDGVASTFAFGSRYETWKATVGFYIWPCWFHDGKTFLRLGQKIAPLDKEVLIYALERSGNTPGDKKLPMDLVRQALGNDEADRIFDAPGRAAFSLYRQNSVYAQATCGTTAELEKVFEAGEEVQKRDLVLQVADDLVYYLEQMKARIDVFCDFAAEARRFRDNIEQNGPQLAAFLEEIDMDSVIEQIETSCTARVMRELVPSGVGVIDQVRALTELDSPDNLKRYQELKAQIIYRGGVLDSCAARNDLLLRGLAQKAGYRCVDAPEKARLAKALRVLIRQYLRNPTQWEQVRSAKCDVRSARSRHQEQRPGGTR